MQRKLKIMLFSSALFIFAAGLFGPIYAVFVEGIGGDLMTAGSAYAAFSLTTGLLMLLTSRWADRVKNQEWIIIAGYGFGCMGFLGYLFIRTPIDLFIVQVVFGVSGAIMAPAFDGLYSRHLDEGKFASQWGMWEAMYSIVTGVAAFFGGILVTLYGFRFIFFVMFVFSLLSLFVSLFLIAEENHKGKPRRWHILTHRIN